MERRDLLRAGALAAAVAIAGCADDDEDDDPEDDGADDLDEADDDTADEPEETDDDDPDTDDADDGLEDDDDETEGDDDDDEAEGDDEEEEADEDDAEDDEADDDDEMDDGEDADDAESEGVLFAETIAIEDSYAFEAEGTGEAGETFASRGRVDGENTYMVMEEGGEEIEMYTIEGETYIVEGEECMVLPGMADEEFEEEEDVEDPDAEAEAHPELEDSGRTTIEGVDEDVYIFEIDGDEAAEHDEDVTYYVGVETGYVHRIESGPSTTDFHSWGEADPVEPPEMDCMSLGDFDEDDLPI